MLTTDFSHIFTGIPGHEFSVHAQVSHPTARYNTCYRPPSTTFNDVHPRPYVTHQYEAAAFQCAANHETEQSVHMPFEENLAQGDNRYCSVEPGRTFRLDALKHNNNYAKAGEWSQQTPHATDSTNHMDPRHTYPYQNWYDWPRSGYNDQMFCTRDYISIEEPSQPHYSCHAPDDMSIRDTPANAGPYQEGYPNQYEGSTKSQTNSTSEARSSFT